MDNLEIGTLVKWKLGTKTVRGIFKQFNGNVAEVITKSIDDTKVSVRTYVDKSIIELDNGIR